MPADASMRLNMCATSPGPIAGLSQPPLRRELERRLSVRLAAPIQAARARLLSGARERTSPAPS
jgi:hypothetical protein